MTNPVIVPLATATLCTIFALAATAEAATPTRPPGKAMSAKQVQTLYGDRTWLWTNGAGHFAADGSFLAWSGSSTAKSSYAKGRWYATGDGSMCFEATWHVLSGAKGSTTCFMHRSLGRTIYQRKNPSGPWYEFRHTPVAAKDEFRKLVRGDRVTAKIARLEAAFARLAPSQPLSMPSDAAPVTVTDPAATPTGPGETGPVPAGPKEPPILPSAAPTLGSPATGTGEDRSAPTDGRLPPRPYSSAEGHPTAEAPASGAVAREATALPVHKPAQPPTEAEPSQ
ncbi:DUF995 domain-containing protein [Microvirga zambiensis]|uniref:DUF995 domain-containing protein n=1 Tax=Microvirga zambiensis TaxID=1402137 RepID=UPI00191D3415